MGTVAQSLDRLLAARNSGELAALCERQELELLVLFGSAASREETSREPADIDLAIASRGGGSVDLLAVIDDLAQLVGGDHLDVMDLAMADPVAMHRAMTGGEVLYEGEPHAFAEKQIFAINHYIDTAHMRRAVLESLTR